MQTAGPSYHHGRFNLKVGEGREENVVGLHGFGVRNKRKEKLVE